ncbi:unnamed protein product [Phaedon cochleariae]|uniref:Protein lava lamp n=1 Tax=Phaedon cochleariae TaxID=80249 RepID=A0A9P0DPF2_PHACE|nr:unnamed protein product [Phaedon cochleariae]
MWSEPDPDPGGERPATSVREITELKDQNEQQQVLIAQLKEMLRKEQSTVSQEKVEEYMNTLSKMHAKKPRTKQGEAGKTERVGSTGPEGIKSEKVNLLKRQLEENKAKLAERGIRQKGIEDMVSTLKAQLNDSHHVSSTSLPLPSVDKNLEYSKTSSQEELYNILLVKERKITDLLEKNHKNESLILDLQENVKEKDSVIDARTKAITLMTESLSKKGKDTLDALDDTKDQMRTMQEQFVQLEAEMKARQMKLLEDLKFKNLEIVKLQESIQNLNEEKSEYQKHSNNCEKNDNEGFEKIIKDLQDQLNQTNSLNEKHLATISELNKDLQESKHTIEVLKNSSFEMDMAENPTNSNDIAKLKKQLDESNKNMIKMKAQSKSKIKELTKKIDAFKKISDANALVVQLQHEITSLNEKIAVLEEEKGNLQLKMVESTESTKESAQEGNEFIEENSRILEEKEKVISLLESDVMSLREEINNLNEKVANSQKVQVTSEMNSIQIEEEIDRIETENKKLQEIVEDLTNDKHNLELRIEELVKEKQELNTKLDNYIQENMELIDKLEKLSAEKVSSAESIEIVEGLTQQEKLELAAYQKNVDPHCEESAKASEDDPIETPRELNESVLQLKEDSAELLKKIEMFNMERKEVMVKMETLKEENGRLALKVDEIENNRDVLAETYEQLHTEKEELQREKEELQRENESLMSKLSEIESKAAESLKISVRDDAELTSELQSLQMEYEKLKEEKENLRQTLKEFDTKVHEKDNLESQLSESRSRIEELETNLNTNLEEISNYRMIIEENKNELINSSNIINSLQNILREREKDIKELNIIISDLNNVVNDLQTANEKLGSTETMEKQLDELKTALNEQIEDAEAQAKEYQDETARTRNYYEQKLQENYKEIERLTQEMTERDLLTKTLENQMHEKEAKINKVIEDMQQKYLALQKQLDNRIEEMTNKSKDQLEKMKKIAANLKKKTQAYQELEEKYQEDKEKWETELNLKETSSSNQLSQLEAAKEELAWKTAKIEELTDMVASLDQQRTELEHTLLQMKHERDKLSEVSLSRELSTSLHEEFDKPLPESASEDKIKELELIIETNEAESAHYKERSQKLEQDVSRLLEEKEFLERRQLELEDMLSRTSKSIEEKSMIEEELGQKLEEASANDKKLEEASAENKELVEKNREQEELIYKLKVKLKKSHERVNQLKASQANVEELETSNEKLRQALDQMDNAQKHAHEEYEAMQKKYEMDFERIESDYQVQMEELLTNKNELTVECEKLQETLGSLREREEALLGEVSEYKIALEKQNQDDNQIQQLKEDLTVATNNLETSCKEIEILKQQIEELQKQIVVQVAESAVEDVLLEAKHQVFFANTKDTQTENVTENIIQFPEHDQQNVPMFHWPTKIEESSESFLQPVQPASQSQIAEVSKEDLVHQITNSKNSATPLAFSPLEAQILSSEDIADAAKDLKAQQEMEFEKCHPFIGQQNVAVVEELIQPKEAYICHQDQEGTQAASEVTKEQLVSKIKALEVLLYNVDREKDEIVGECSGMLTELTRLVYEKIMSQEPQAAALEPQPSLELEAQVQSPEDIAAASSDLKTLQQMEFARCDPFLGQQSVQVVEEVQQPKKAYLTYQGSSEAFAENDDGWGWGPEEAKLEEEHLHRVDGTPQMQALKDDLRRLNEQVQVLQVERENHLEEIKQLQVKSGKLIKKCKELKQKNDQLVQKSGKSLESSGFFDLDQAIMEELKAQSTTLEKKVEETRNELEKERTEKSTYLRKLESLTSANEKLLEAKEIQNSEVLRWKRKYEEIEEKMQQSEFGIDGLAVAIPATLVPKQPEETSGDSIEELQRIVKELSLDNEELQTLLNEQRQQRIDADKHKHSGRSEDEFMKLSEDHEERVRSLQEQTSIKIFELETALTEKEGEITRLQTDLNEKILRVQSLEESYKQLDDVNGQLETTLTELKQNAESSHDGRISELEALLTEKTIVADQLKTDYDDAIKSNETLNLRIETLNTEMENTKQKYDETISNLQSELREQIQNSQQLGPENINPIVQQLTSHQANSILELVELLHTTQAEFTNLSTSYSELLTTSHSLTERINALEQELITQAQHYTDLQSSSSKNILDLQTDLEETKQKLDQLEIESSEKIVGMEKELKEEKLRYQELQLATQQLEAQKVTDHTSKMSEQVSHLEELLAEKEANIAELKNITEDLHTKRAIVEEEMKELKNALNEKQIELDNVTAEVENKLSNTISELEQKWQIIVDERGNTVAESWKYHLGAVESEFSRVQEQLKNEINELEEKCNALVNENNELRKNVDTEIKNEVDRISALQQQITDRQHAITDLNRIISGLETERVEIRQQFDQLQNEKVELDRILAQKDAELSSSKVVIETTQKQFHEKREVIEEIVKILERRTSWPLSFEKEEVLNEFQRQLDLIQEREEELARLNSQMADLQSHLQERVAEIVRLSDLVNSLQAENSMMQEKDQEISRLNQTVEHLHSQMSSLQQNEQEIIKLNDLIGQLQRQEVQYQQTVQTLQQEREDSKYAVEDYKKKLEEFKLTHIALQNSLEEKNQQISSLNQQLQIWETFKNDSNKEKERIDAELSNVKQEYYSLQQSLSECQQHLFSVTQDLGNKSHELETCNQQLAYSKQNSEVLESELCKLRELLRAKEQETVQQAQLSEVQNYYEEVISAKDIDLEKARVQLNESISNNEELSEKFNNEMSEKQQVLLEKRQLEDKYEEQRMLLEEEDKQLSEMRDIIQEQVVKIEELKKELLDKSKDYDSLIAEMDMGSKPVTQQPTSSMIENPSIGNAQRSFAEDDMSEPVNRAELDLALYMLHQRDVRCEELTVELTQLLEERDTLQLKLSNALREKEDIRRSTAVSEEMPSSSTAQPSTLLSKSSAIFLAASGTDLGTEPLESPSGDQNLASKLSELRRVGYKKDKTFVDEQELRRFQQMSIMQQHISEVDRLPAEAAAKLVDANYTLSRDVQSPSKVLLNWLWGRSTPKLNDS